MLSNKWRQIHIFRLFLCFQSTLTSTILEGQIREPPYVPQSHRIANHGQNEIQFVGPVSSGLILISSLVIIVSLRGRKTTSQSFSGIIYKCNLVTTDFKKKKIDINLKGKYCQ